MKTSGEGYVQDFINVLEGNDCEKITSPGSPRSIIKPPLKPQITNSPATITNISPQSPQANKPPSKLAIEADPKSPKSPKKVLSRPPQLKMEEEGVVVEEMKRAVSPRNERSNLYLSEKGGKVVVGGCDGGGMKGSCEVKCSGRANEWQKKVS